jgi:hypothetical protein
LTRSCIACIAEGIYVNNPVAGLHLNGAAKEQLSEQLRSRPQLGGTVMAASRKTRRKWMKSDRVNTAETTVSSQSGDACRGTAIRVQQPQVGGIV